MPDRIVAWFSETAPAIVESQSLPNSTATPDDTGRVFFPFGSTVGKPVTIMTWGETFLQASDPTTDMLELSDDWEAPIMTQGHPVGTLLAELTDGGDITYRLDTDSGIAAILLGVRDDDIVASDEHSGLFVFSDGEVRQYGMEQWGVEPIPGTVKQLQGAILAQRARGPGLTDAGYIDLSGYIQAPLMSRISPWWWVLALVVGTGGLGAGAVLSRRHRASGCPYSCERVVKHS